MPGNRLWDSTHKGTLVGLNACEVPIALSQWMDAMFWKLWYPTLSQRGIRDHPRQDVFSVRPPQTTPRRSTSIWTHTQQTGSNASLDKSPAGFKHTAAVAPGTANGLCQQLGKGPQSSHVSLRLQAHLCAKGRQERQTFLGGETC